jgi:hypothetical protein
MLTKGQRVKKNNQPKNVTMLRRLVIYIISRFNLTNVKLSISVPCYFYAAYQISHRLHNATISALLWMAGAVVLFEALIRIVNGHRETKRIIAQWDELERYKRAKK